MAELRQYRWILIFYHAGVEDSRVPGSQWFDSLDHCKQVAEDLDFDYCCSDTYFFEYESRAKEVNKVNEVTTAGT